jgi:hypothetical protein
MSNLIDGKLETCWNSDEGEIQYVYYKFKGPVNISRFELTFQGGFGAEQLQIQVGEPIIVTDDNNDNDNDNDDDDDDNGGDDNNKNQTKTKIGLKTAAFFSSQDASSTQTFTFGASDVYAVKVTFTQMADMFGRVILYDLKFYGDQR